MSVMWYCMPQVESEIRSTLFGVAGFSATVYCCYCRDSKTHTHIHTVREKYSIHWCGFKIFCGKHKSSPKFPLGCMTCKIVTDLWKSSYYSLHRKGYMRLKCYRDGSWLYEPPLVMTQKLQQFHCDIKGLQDCWLTLHGYLIVSICSRCRDHIFQRDEKTLHTD